MTRKITKQQRFNRRMTHTLNNISFTMNRITTSASELSEQFQRLALALQGKSAAWPQFNHEKETPERSRMHAMYGRRRNG